MADSLHTLSIVFFGIAIGFVILAIIFWFVFKIPRVIGDLSGKNAQKSIARMRQNNEKSGNKFYKANEKNVARERFVGAAKELESSDDKGGTGLLNENLAKGYEEEATGLLVDESTELLGDSGETASLDETAAHRNRPPSSVVIGMTEEVMMIHTEEII